jgi:ubiquinone biosynthesis protein COQ4
MTSVQPLRAWRAIASLAHNPDDTAQVFALIEALSGISTPRRIARRLSGSRIWIERPDILAHLTDRDALARMPEGSLAHAYLSFVESEGITAEGLRRASDLGEADREIDPDLEYVRRRMRDIHDLWHTVLGYRGDVLGEASVLAFTFAQTRNPAIGALVLLGLAKLHTREARRLIVAALLRGFRAAAFPEQEWEALLPLPLDEVRRRLRAGPPPEYLPVRTGDLRALGLLA